MLRRAPNWDLPTSGATGARGGGINQAALKSQIADTPSSPGARRGGVGLLMHTGTAFACLGVAQGPSLVGRRPLQANLSSVIKQTTNQTLKPDQDLPVYQLLAMAGWAYWLPKRALANPGFL